MNINTRGWYRVRKVTVVWKVTFFETGHHNLWLIGLWIKARGLGQGCTRPAGRAPGRPSPRVAGPRAGSTFFDRASWFFLVFSKWDIGNTSLCVASPEQANSHSSDASYHGEQGYNSQQYGILVSTHLDIQESYLVTGTTKFAKLAAGTCCPYSFPRSLWSLWP